MAAECVHEGGPADRRLGNGAAGAAVWLAGDGDRIADVGIGLTAVGATHFVAAEAEFLRQQASG